MAKKTKYSYLKLLWKVLKIFIYAGIGGVLSWLTGLPNTPTILLAIAVLSAVMNYWKVKVNGNGK